MNHKVEGIVIYTQDYGEGSKIIRLFTKEMGKIALIARGAKKTKSRFSSVTDLMMHGLFLFYRAGGGLGNLNQGDLIHSFRHVREDLFRSASASYLIELTDKSLEEGEPHPILFQLLLDSLVALDEGKDIEIITRLFELQYLREMGTKPELFACVSCHRTNLPFVAFSVREGGVLCEACLHKDPESIILSPKTGRILQILSSIHGSRLGQVEIREETRAQLKKVIYSFMESYLPLQLKSRRVLEQLLKGYENP